MFTNLHNILFENLNLWDPRRISIKLRHWKLYICIYIDFLTSTGHYFETIMNHENVLVWSFCHLKNNSWVVHFKRKTFGNPILYVNFSIWLIFLGYYTWMIQLCMLHLSYTICILLFTFIKIKQTQKSINNQSILNHRSRLFIWYRYMV